MGSLVGSEKSTCVSTNTLPLPPPTPSVLFFLKISYDVVLDATDNVATRYLLNDACVLAKKPLVSGSALRFEGQVWW